MIAKKLPAHKSGKLFAKETLIIYREKNVTFVILVKKSIILETGIVLQSFLFCSLCLIDAFEAIV